MKLILPLILLIIGTGGGVGAALFLKPAAPPESEHAAIDCVPGETPVTAATPTAASHDSAGSDGHAETPETEYAKLANQFVVPVIADNKVAAMVVVTLGIAVPPGGKDGVFAVEPRLRDGLLQVMFNHANIGGFSGNFTSTSNMRTLRGDLLRSAQSILGDGVLDVLVLDIVRQDV